VAVRPDAVVSAVAAACSVVPLKEKRQIVIGDAPDRAAGVVGDEQ
jgi:hypothetical protein